MVEGNPKIPATRPEGVGIPTPRRARAEGPPAPVDRPRARQNAPRDPFDLESALARLRALLDGDTNGPRLDVPRGYYLDILV